MHAYIVLLLVLLAAPAWAQPPNHRGEVERLAREQPAAFACAHTPAACGHDFIKLLACDLHAIDARFGLNGKRGNPNDLSWDAINWCGGGPGHDPTGQCRGGLTVIDVIGAAGSPAATPAWNVFSDLPGPGAWVRPSGCGTPAPTPIPTPTPTPTPPPDPGPTHQQLMTRIGAVESDVKALSAAVSQVALRLERAVDQAEVAAHHAKVGAEAILITKDWLAQGLAVRLSSRFLGVITGTAKHEEPQP